MRIKLTLAACFAHAMWAATTVSIEDGNAVVRNVWRVWFPKGAKVPACEISVHIEGFNDKLLGTCTPKQEGKSWAFVFTPRFPFSPGVAYHADLPTIDIHNFLPFRLPKVEKPRTKVAAVYPSTNRIPDNQLKLYIQFSGPMSKGEVYQRVRLLNQRGQREQFAILELDQELWNREQTRVTLLFDPGRVKRGVKPNRDDGAPLRVGENYTLVIDAAWPDSNGQPLEAEFRKPFTVVASDREPIDTAKWTITAPKAGTRDPLRINFGEPLDRAMLDSALRLSIPGKVTVEANETQWLFTPTQPWQPATHTLEADTMLEDLAGNKIGREFDIDTKVTRDRQLDRTWKKIPFTIR